MRDSRCSRLQGLNRVQRAACAVLVAAVAAGAGVIAACSGAIDEHPTRPLDGAVADVWAGDAGPVSAVDSRAPSEAAAPDAGEDAAPSCPPPPDSTLGVFVDGTSGSDTDACGTPAAPCATLTAGQQRALALSKGFVWVAHGQYAPGYFSFTAGLTLQGGWTVDGGTWTADCSPQASNDVTILSTVTAQDLGGTATLQTLTVSNKAPLGEARVFGVIAEGSTTTLILNDVIVRNGDGTAGQAGFAGTAGPPATFPFGPDAGCVPGNGADGVEMLPGDESGGFDFSSGFLQGGDFGAEGGVGQNGMAGGYGQCATTPCYCAPGTLCPTPYCALPGVAGCGGPGGGPGQPGSNGGFSIPLFVDKGATVVVNGGLLHAGNGGAGGAGGAGGTGGDPTAGPGGSQVYCWATWSDGGSQSGLITLAGGTPGTPGGRGGTGGAGAGGKGGSSCSYLALDSATVTVHGTRLEFGQAGAGGLPNGTPGLAKAGCP